MNGRIFIFMFLLLSLLGHLGSSVAARGVDITAPSHSLEAAAGVAHNLVANPRDGSNDVGFSKVEVTVDGTNWVMATGTSSWSATVTLPVGESVIQVRAIDTAGNTATATASVIVEFAGDGQPVDLVPKAC